MKKELTIYDVQVNCARLSKEKIENLKKIVMKSGAAISDDDFALKKINNQVYFSYSDGVFALFSKCYTQQSISYARFVKMFDKKELGVGKWYKDSSKTHFVFRQNNHNNSGVIDSEWKDKLFSCSNYSEWTLATEKEVTTILVTEAKKRFGEDWENAKIKANADGDECKNPGDYCDGYSFLSDRLWNKNGLIYEKGKWAELLVEELTQFTNQQMESNVDIVTIENPSQETKDMCMELRRGKEEEKINKPTHYKTKSGYDVIDIAQDNNLNFNLGAVCKYVLRAGKKLYPNMNEKQSYLADLKKAQDHLNREIEYVESNL